MITLLDAAKQAIKAMETCSEEDYSTSSVIHKSYDEIAIEKAITDLRVAIEKTERVEKSEKVEPVAYWWRNCFGFIMAKGRDELNIPSLGVFPAYSDPFNIPDNLDELVIEVADELFPGWHNNVKEVLLPNFTRRLISRIQKY